MIDLDESTVKTNAPMRSDSIEGSKEDFVYLRYPNYFCAWRHRVLYTQTQLVASFLLLVSYLDDESLQENQKDPVKDLIFWHKRPMNTSRRNNAKPRRENARPSEVTKAISALDVILELYGGRV